MATEPRVKILRRNELSDEAKAALEDFEENSPIRGSMDSTTELGVLSEVLLHNPEVYRGSTAFSSALLRHGGISAPKREIITLRVGWLCKSSVVWSNHTKHAHKAGMDESELGQVALGPEAEGWNERERALLRMVDELHESATVSDATWSELAKHYEVAQLVALPMFVGLYFQLAFTFNALGVPEPDPSLGGLAAR